MRVYNISKKVLTSDEIKVLNKGLNFAPTPKHVPKDQYICNLEPIIQNLPSEVRPKLRL